MELIEISLPQLNQQAIAAFPNTRKRQHAMDTLNIVAIKMIPMQGAILIKTACRNMDEPDKTYDQNVLVKDVQYVDKETPNAVSFTGSDGNEYYIEPIVAAQHDAQVSCNCLDFYWRFANTDFSRDALYGNKPDTYIKQTNRQEANPTNSPGICKHLMKGIERIAAERVIR